MLTVRRPLPNLYSFVSSITTNTCLILTNSSVVIVILDYRWQ